MGGNALSVPIRRLEAEEFKSYEAEVCKKLLKKFPILAPTLYYKNKTSFGDLDVIVQKPKPNRDELIKFLEEEFQTKEIYFNSDVVSFEYKDFQVDLIFMSEENFETSCHYYGYNDICNLLGRIFHKIDLSFGHTGLNYIIRDKRGSLKKRFLISKDPQKIYEFIGLDYNKYLEGFDELEDIFKFVTTSKYFNKEIFNYENLNHTNRTRNRKRTTYASFLKWLENKEFNNYEFNSDKTIYIPMIEEFFNYPLSEEIKKIEAQMTYNRFLATKFNGTIVMEVLGIEGKELGTYISYYKESFINCDFSFEEFIEQQDIEVIKNDIKCHYEMNKYHKILNNY